MNNFWSSNPTKTSFAVTNQGGWILEVLLYQKRTLLLCGIQVLPFLYDYSCLHLSSVTRASRCPRSALYLYRTKMSAPQNSPRTSHYSHFANYSIRMNILRIVSIWRMVRTYHFKVKWHQISYIPHYWRTDHTVLGKRNLITRGLGRIFDGFPILLKSSGSQQSHQ